MAGQHNRNGSFSYVSRFALRLGSASSSIRFNLEIRGFEINIYSVGASFYI